MSTRLSSPRSRQRGMATLITVMVLVLVLSVTFAFANRSLVFEQRTGANQQRAMQAREIAEAGLEWALAQLNNPRNTTLACLDPRNSGAAAPGPFSRRYIGYNETTKLYSGLGLRPACRLGANGATTCACPTSGAPLLGGTGGHFSVEFTVNPPAAPEQPLPPRVIGITVHGCTDTGVAGAFDPRCIPGGTGEADGYARTTMRFAKQAAVTTVPAAAITAKGNVTWMGNANSLNVANTDAATNGITVNAGGTVGTASGGTGSPGIYTMPGSPNPAESVLASDASLANLSGDKYFQTFLGKTKQAFYDDPTTLRLSGASVDGKSLETQIQEAIQRNERVIWVGPNPSTGTTGSFSLSGGLTYGTPDAPVILVFNGAVQITGNSTINGLLYSTALSWDNTGGGNALLRGALVAEGGYTANGSLDVIYDPKILALLNGGDAGLGSFLRVPGSWRDFSHL